MSVGKTDTIISKKDTQKTSDAQPAFATTARRVSVQYRISRTETEKQAQSKIQISVFKRNRFISSCRISICRSGCKRLRIFSRRSGSMAARSRTSLSRLLYLEYLLQPMPTARRAEMIQTVMSVPETIRKTSNAQRPTSNIKFNPFFRCSREAGRLEARSEAVFRSAKVECNLSRRQFSFCSLNA